MNRNLYITSLAVLMLSILFGITACTSEIFDEDVPSIGKGLVLQLTPATPSLDPLIRATEAGNDALNENTINTLNMFFFPHNAADTQACFYTESASNLGFTGTSAHQQVLQVAQNLFTAGVIYDIYTLANLPVDAVLPNPLTLGALKALHTVTPISASVTQTQLMMDGMVSAIPNPVTQTPMVIIPVPLKRAVSKIRLNMIVNPSSPMSAATSASVVLNNYPTRGAVLDGHPYTLTSDDYTNSTAVTGAPASTFTFYAYESNWSTAPANETYLMVNMPYGTRATNYYRIAVNRYSNNNTDGQNPSGTNVTGCLQRNMIYDVTAYINNPGTDTPTGAVSITGNYTITNWTNYNIVLQTINQHYLGIGEYSIVMPNVATHTLSYVADLPVSVVNVTATCTQYNSDASTTQITYTSGQPQFPLFVVNPVSSTITITSAIPVNYVPKYISLTVTNGQGLSLTATIVQYPAIYVTARPSTGNVKPEWYQDGTQTNYNLFTVNTLVPSSNGSYALGDPTYGNAKTDSLAAGNTLVSPSFIIASQYAIYPSVTYSAAQQRCYQYGEDIYRSGWRMPTKAELLIISAIQGDANSAVKKLLSGTAYWSAYQYQYYNFTGSAWVSGNATTANYIRCVYDAYKHN